MTEIPSDRNLYKEKIMGIGPGARFRVRSKILEEDVRSVTIKGFEVHDRKNIEPDEVWVRVRGSQIPQYSLQELLNGLGGSSRCLDVEWLNPPRNGKK